MEGFLNSGFVTTMAIVFIVGIVAVQLLRMFRR